MNLNVKQLGLKEAIKRIWEHKILMPFIWLLPKTIVYWCAVRLISRATVREFSSTIVPELKAIEALERWKLT